MRRAATAVALLAALLLAAPGAATAAPGVTLSAATNVQGVSALLKGTVDPEGLPTAYRFEYSTAANFAGALSTPLTPAGSLAGPRPARAAIAGLSPSTTYHYRLVATSSSGTETSAPAQFSTTAGFGFAPGAAGFAARVYVDGGAAATQAASHPYQLDLHLGLNQGGEFEGQPGVPFPDGDLRDLRLELPPGLILNPGALDKCSASAFNTRRSSPFSSSRSGESCPDRTQVGTVEVQTSLGGGATWRFGVFNLVPPPGVPAQLGFAPFGMPITLDVLLEPGAGGTYSLALEAGNIPQSLDISGLDLALWGTPWAASHNGERGDCLNEAEPEFPWAKCSVGEPVVHPPLAYLTLPGNCSPSLPFTVAARAWQQPGQVSRAAVNRDGEDDPVPVTACQTVPFTPQAEGLLSNDRASSPSGFVFRLRNDNSTLTSPNFRAPTAARRVVVALPGGVTINPSVGAGLGTCAPAQYAAETAFNGQGAGCPNASKIGDFTVRTPLFDGLFSGAAYLARPDHPATAAPGAENPFDSLIAVYLVAKHPQRGVLIKVAGRIDPNPASGDLTATFEGLPQLPYSDLEVSFRAGQRSLFATPPACGAAITGIHLTPWSDGAAVSVNVGSAIVAGAGSGPCPAPGAPPFSPEVVTGGVNSNVGSYTPYFVRLSRGDAEQELTSYSLVLPKGVTGKLAGIPFCPEGAIAAARVKLGVDETANPSCPAASQVGQTVTGYGVGSALTYAPGRVYLAGPYQGQPLSLVTVNAATVGPFDLGTIVIRSAFAVDQHTAQLRIDAGSSDPIPHIIGGIPLHLRDIRIHIDRHEFTHNPSSCEPAAMVSTLSGSGARFDDPADDSSVTVSRHFQLLNCLTLGFRPKLGLRLRGGVRRGAYPSLRATFAARGPRDSNLKRIEVKMPRSLFLAHEHIRSVCSPVQFAAERCPPGSIYGNAVLHTPLFDEPLRGPVYLRSSRRRTGIPDLVASLRSGAVRIVLEGRIGPSKGGGISALFNNVPDAPINRFVMTLYGGKRGLLVNSSNICQTPPPATVSALGQNNIGARFSSTLRGQCKGKGKGKKRKNMSGQQGRRANLARAAIAPRGVGR